MGLLNVGGGCTWASTQDDTMLIHVGQGFWVDRTDVIDALVDALQSDMEGGHLFWGLMRIFLMLGRKKKIQYAFFVAARRIAPTEIE